MNEKKEYGISVVSSSNPKDARKAELGWVNPSRRGVVGGNLDKLRLHFKDGILLDQMFDWFQHLLSAPFNRLSHHFMEKFVYLW
ncbi:MAG TPA: hypothetical protein HA346_00880 [Thermoplasmata archaeon]|nr:hypothetical protein [Thermoplasmata archaeon]HIH97557.1 hypothetical protein [Thermoplasmata archaeon]